MITKDEYLEKHVFYGLTNLNDGFDAPSIKYFDKEDFKTVLTRANELGIEITGIEPFKNGKFYTVVTPYDIENDSNSDTKWYFKAFEDFVALGEELQYAASYDVPDKLLKKEK